MDVRRPSLYAIFGDKTTLFIKCLNAYQVRFGKPVMEAFLAPQSVQDAIRALLRISVENATGENSPSGCLFVCVAPLVENDYVRNYLKNIDLQMASAVAARLQQGVKEHQLPTDFPCDSRARMLMDLSRGMVIRARIGVSRNDLLRDTEEQASLLLGFASSPSLAQGFH